MESRCSLIRGNVTDKTWASRYTSSPAIQQLLLPDFIVSLVHKSQLPRRAGPRRPAPTIIKIELSLIELSRFSPEYLSAFFCVFHIRVNEQLHSHHHHLLDFIFLLLLLLSALLFSFTPPVSAVWKCYTRQTTKDLQKTTTTTKNLIWGNHMCLPESLSCLINRKKKKK